MGIKTIEEVADGSTLLDIFPKEKEIEKLFTCILKNSIIVHSVDRFGVPMAALISFQIMPCYLPTELFVMGKKSITCY